MNDEPLVAESLVKALVNKTAVVFVGAGASVPSDLPLWREFLEKFIHEAKAFMKDEDWKRAGQFLKGGDFLLAAEMLQRGMEQQDFNSYIEQIFDAGKKPNDIHRSIARLPFDLSITTNFDTLLEDSYRDRRCYTWREKDDIFEAIRLGTPAVVKLHGSIRHNATLRLTRSDYRDMSFAATNLEFNECLKFLLTWKTFLFVGYSLRDSDLLRLMDETRMRFGNKFGPHYAIMPRTDVDGAFRKYLQDALCIKCILYDVDDEGGHEKPIVDKLKDIAGRVAKLGHKAEVAADDFVVTRRRAAQSVLENCVTLTGSIRGDVCMMESDVNPVLSRVAMVSKKIPPELAPNSVIHTAFLQANALNGPDYIYLTDTSTRQKANEELRRSGYPNAEYTSCEDEVQSELAYPITADGRRVGVLNLESDLKDAYTHDHIDVIRKVADRLGQIYLRSEWRRRASEPLAGYYQHPHEFAKVLNRSRLIKTLNHEFILYEIDYERERLVAHRANDRRKFDWTFDEPSLARQVFQGHSAIHISDVRDELGNKRETELNALGVSHFDISGPVFACPVRAGGQTDAVLVTWLKSASDQRSQGRPKQQIEKWFRSSAGQVLRLANLLASDIYESGSWRAKEFLRSFYDSLNKIDHGELWTQEKLEKIEFRDQIINELMTALLHKSSGLKCVRVWETTRKSDLAHQKSAVSQAERFRCIASLTDEEGTAPGKKTCGAYVGVTSGESDAYCRYTISRFRHDPFAKWQHPAMFEHEDVNFRRLDKDPKGSWIVAPIVRPRNGSAELLGFISADSHDRKSGVPKYLPEPDTRVIALQCRIMDLIAELARHVVAINGPRSRNASKGKR